MTEILLSANTDWFLHNFRASFADYLIEKGCQVTMVSPPGKYSHSFLSRGYKWIPWELGRQTVRPWDELASILQLAKIYRREKADLLHHHTIKPVLYGSLVARLLRKRNVVNSITGRGYVFLSQEPRARWLKGITSTLYRLALNNDNYALIFENDTDRRYFIEHGFVPEFRTRLISGIGVDPQRFHPQEEHASTPMVLFSGRMLTDKGVGVLVEAARILHKHVDVRVLLVGEPDPGNPASIQAEQLDEWHREGVIEWLGFQSNMPDIYAQSTVVALPTMYGEGVPTVLIEAAACGKATVATDMPGCTDITIHNQTGLIVPKNDPVALSEALYLLISDPGLRVKMGRAGRKLVLEKFTTRIVNDATFEVYQEVLEHSLTSR